ncbi:unnamed protein product [Ectocarpus sp. 12 AP-2014]
MCFKSRGPTPYLLPSSTSRACVASLSPMQNFRYHAPLLTSDIRTNYRDKAHLAGLTLRLSTAVWHSYQVYAQREQEYQKRAYEHVGHGTEHPPQLPVSILPQYIARFGDGHSLAHLA